MVGTCVEQRADTTIRHLQGKLPYQHRNHRHATILTENAAQVSRHGAINHQRISLDPKTGTYKLEIRVKDKAKLAEGQGSLVEFLKSVREGRLFVACFLPRHTHLSLSLSHAHIDRFVFEERVPRLVVRRRVRAGDRARLSAVVWRAIEQQQQQQQLSSINKTTQPYLFKSFIVF
jgi:hypothetical protein